MRIWITCEEYSASDYSGLYIYELSKALTQLGHDVVILALRLEGKMIERAKANGVQTFHMNDITTRTLSVPDVIHTNQQAPTRIVCHRFPEVPKVTTVHSEVLVRELPLLHPSIKAYIGVRPSIVSYLEALGYAEGGNASSEENAVAMKGEREGKGTGKWAGRGTGTWKVHLIWHPVDRARFYPKPRTGRERKKVLLTGPYDYLHEKVIRDLYHRSRQGASFTLRLTGRDTNMLWGLDGIELAPDIWDIEREIWDCDETAGIFLDRSIVTGWVCNRPGWVYTVDMDGNLTGEPEYLEPPDDLEQFDSRLVAQQTVTVYDEILG